MSLYEKRYKVTKSSTNINAPRNKPLPPLPLLIKKKHKHIPKPGKNSWADFQSYLQTQKDKVLLRVRRMYHDDTHSSPYQEYHRATNYLNFSNQYFNSGPSLLRLLKSFEIDVPKSHGPNSLLAEELYEDAISILSLV